MSFRRFGLILRNLPMDSAFHASVRDTMTPEQYEAAIRTPRDNKYGRWSLEAMLAARTGDLMEARIWQASGNKGERPAPYPRPGVKPMASVTPINEAAIEYLLKTRELRGAHPSG